MHRGTCVKMSWCRLILIWLAPALVLGQDCSITSVSHRGETDTSVLMSWTTDCKDVLEYKLYPKHLRWKSCANQTRDKNQHRVDQTGDTSYRLQQLDPYSDYEVEIMAVLTNNRRPAETRVNVSTLEGTPDTLPRSLATPPRPYSQAIKFAWQPPAKANCAWQNGRLDGYYMELWAEDDWVQLNRVRPVWNRTLGANVHEVYVQSLLPYTQYTLRVFTRNRNGLFNRRLPLELTARTAATVPKPPGNIKLSFSSRSSLHMRWSPPYPPTGRVDKYVIRVGQRENGTSQVIWRERVEVPADQYCIKGISGFSRVKDPICRVFADLAPDTIYVFEVQTTNADVDSPSRFSNPVTIRTDPDPTQETTSKTELIAGEGSYKGGTRTPRADNTGYQLPTSTRDSLIAILLFVIAIFVVIVVITTLVYKIKMRQVKMRYEQQQNSTMMTSPGQPPTSPNYRSSSVSSGSYLPSLSERTHASYVDQWASSQIEEIQRRRLPEPPPAMTDAQLRRVSRLTEEDSGMAVYSDAYCNPDADAPTKYMDMTTPGQRETTDIHGYLKPTFHASPSASNSKEAEQKSPATEETSDYVSNESNSGGSAAESAPIPIPTASYVTPQTVGATSSDSRTESLPRTFENDASGQQAIVPPLTLPSSVSVGGGNESRPLMFKSVQV